MLRVRRMTVFDIEEVVKQELEVFKSTLGFQMLYNEITTNNLAKYYVLEKDDFIIGYIGTWMSKPNGQIINFYITPKYQGLGYGKFFLNYVLDKFKEENIEVITLEVRVSNLVAQKLYEKCGFQKGIIRNNYYPDNEDAIIMIKYN